MILKHTCICASDDDDLSGQIGYIFYIELALGRETLVNYRRNNAHGWYSECSEREVSKNALGGRSSG